MRKSTALIRIRSLSELLGWRRLHQFQHRLRKDPDRKVSAKTVTWYECGNLDSLCLMVTQYPIGQHDNYLGSVYAMRYRIFSGHHEFSLVDEALSEAVERLNPWLSKAWFESPKSRRTYRSTHPECAGWSFGRIRRERPLIHYRDGNTGM